MSASFFLPREVPALPRFDEPPPPPIIEMSLFDLPTHLRTLTYGEFIDFIESICAGLPAEIAKQVETQTWSWAIARKTTPGMR